MDIIQLLPETPVGRHTRWLWSELLAVANGCAALNADEVSDHFASCVFENVTADELMTQWSQLAPSMPLVTELVEEVSTNHRYSALLGFPGFWLRYTCVAQDEEPYLLMAAYCIRALDPQCYDDKRVQYRGRDVQIRDFRGTGPLMLLWHGAGCDVTSWEALVPSVPGFHVVGQDLPGHGRSSLNAFSISDAILDADAVIEELNEGPPTVVGHSLGGYLGLRYAATRTCTGWVGLDGPVGLVYPWDLDEPGMSESSVQIGREISAIDVARDLASIKCPSMLLLCASADNQMEERIVPFRRKLAEHIEQHHSMIHLAWLQTGHDTMLIRKANEIADRIRELHGHQNGRT